MNISEIDENLNITQLGLMGFMIITSLAGGSKTNFGILDI